MDVVLGDQVHSNIVSIPIDRKNKFRFKFFFSPSLKVSDWSISISGIFELKVIPNNTSLHSFYTPYFDVFSDRIFSTWLSFSPCINYHFN